MPGQINNNLDETDVQILSILQRNGRITNAELAKRVGLSPPSVLQRVRQLEVAGFVRGYRADLDHEKLGLSITVWAQVSLALHYELPIERFRKSILEIEEVVECYHVSGEFDFLLRILVPSIQAYEALIRLKLSKIEGIGQIKSCFVLATTKRFEGVSLTEAG